jgi:lipopolysaccharide transport system ATP-binding protein
MNAIEFENVSKRFRYYPNRGSLTIKDSIVKGEFLNYWRKTKEYRKVLDSLSFSIPNGTTFGILGLNGSGKTTLLRMIARIYKPDQGKVTVNGRVILLSLGLGFHPELSGRENIHISGVLYGLTPKQIRQYEESIIDFSELQEYIDAPVRTYSSGMHARLAFSIAVNVDPDILLLDEILAVGDGQFRLKSLDRMDEFKKAGKTIVLVTHGEDFVADWCSQALWLNDGKICAQGDSKEVVKEYEKFLAIP